MSVSSVKSKLQCGPLNFKKTKNNIFERHIRLKVKTEEIVEPSVTIYEQPLISIAIRVILARGCDLMPSSTEPISRNILIEESNSVFVIYLSWFLFEICVSVIS